MSRSFALASMELFNCKHTSGQFSQSTDTGGTHQPLGHCYANCPNRNAVLLCIRPHQSSGGLLALLDCYYHHATLVVFFACAIISLEPIWTYFFVTSRLSRTYYKASALVELFPLNFPFIGPSTSTYSLADSAKTQNDDNTFLGGRTLPRRVPSVTV